MLFVLSMHRSGSSLLTGLLYRYGLNVGDKEALLDEREDNQLGFWERNDVIKLNKSILHKHGRGTMVPDLENHYELTQDEADQLNELVAKFEAEGVNLLKDPRLCVTMPAWRTAIPKLKAVHLVRNPMEVARSLEKRQRFPVAASLALWEYYNICVLRNTKDIDVYYLHFDELVRSPDRIAKKIADWSGAKVVESEERDSFAYKEELVHHKSASCKNFTLTASQLHLNESLSSGEPDSIPEYSQSMLATFAMLDEFIVRGFSPINGKCRDPGDVGRVKVLEGQVASTMMRAHQYERVIARLLNSKGGRLLDRYYQTKEMLRPDIGEKNIIEKLKQLQLMKDDESGE